MDKQQVMGASSLREDRATRASTEPATRLGPDGRVSHSAGPWLLKHGVVENRNVRWVEQTDYRLIARLPDTLTHPDSLWDEARVAANANVIAAAPESHEANVFALEVLDTVYRDWDGEPEDMVPVQEARAKLRAVIAKAQGQ